MKLPVLLLALLASLLVTGCNDAGNVSAEDAKNFSATPDGKNSGIDEVNNNR